MKSHLRSSLAVSSLLLAGLAGPAQAASVTFDLAASPGTVTLPGWPAPVTVWGYAATPGGPPTVPGPVLVVNQGDTVTINLTNGLAEATSLEVTAQGMVPDLVGVAAGGSKAYTFTASSPGTFLYQAGPLPDAQHQVPMGLYGALVVRPTSAPDVPIAGQAYAGAATAFDAEAVLVLSEIDPQLHSAPATFDLRGYAPRYYLINGLPYPGTAPIPALAGQRVLLRYLNAGLQHHSMALLGLNQTVVAADGSERASGLAVVAETLAPGMTLDAITTIPAGAAAGSRFALHDASLKLQNNTGLGTQAGFGGMLTFLAIPAGTGGAAAAPTASNVAVLPSPTAGATAVTVTASVAADASAADTVAGAEYFIDAPGTPGGGVAMTGGYPAGALTVSGTISTAQLAALSSGSHTIFVHGRGTAGGWGSFAFGALVLDKAGPAITGPTFTPSPANGSVGVAVHATANDTAAGGSNVVAGTYAIDAGPAVALAVNVQAPIASLDAVIPAATVTALSDGAHAVTIRAQDAFGNWGTTTPPPTFLVDRTGPTTGVVVASPSPASGAVAVRLTTSVSDGAAGSGVVAAEGFIDLAASQLPPNAPPPGGSGFPFLPTDLAFGGASEAVYADIPQATVAQLTVGTHAIRVRGKDGAGNWGPLTLVNLVRAPLAVADTLTATASAPTPSTSPQVINVAAPGVLGNDLPALRAGDTRAATLVGAPTRIAGSGLGTIRVTCGAATATGVCANGSYRVTLTPVGTNASTRQASKRGTYRFTYQVTINGVASTATTVTITVN